MYQQGDKVNWDWQPRNGYGSFAPRAGVVIKETPKQVKIAVFNLYRQAIQEKCVKPATLSPRTGDSKVDEVLAAEDQIHRC